MKPQKIYEIFTEALADESIKNALMPLIEEKAGGDKIDGQTELFPQYDEASLTAENASLSRKIALLELEIGKLENENTELTRQLTRCKESLDSYSSAYAMQISLYERYKTLSDATARVMKGIFKNNTMSGIFLCGVQPENLKSLRDYTEQLVINSYDSAKSDISILCDLYSYMLSCYNSTFTKPVYLLTDVKAGDDFRPELHHNTGVAKAGRIKAVLLQGCIAAANGRIMRKAVVVL